MVRLEEKLNYGAIIIARLKSKRLKEKVLLKINKKNTLIEYIILKLKKLFSAKNIILATSHKKNDKKILIEAKKNKINYFQGEAVDVLKRIYLAASKNNFSDVFVCTADNPLFDLYSVKKMLNFHQKNKNDFTSANNMPLGAYGWVLKVSSIKKIISKKKKKDTEIWGNFFLQNKRMKCKKYNFPLNKKINHKIRLTVDTIEDLILVKNVLKLSKTQFPSLVEIDFIIKKNKYLLKINSMIKQKKAPRNVF
jgi:spore coat polysaccharide biosynthesis protein SpsF